MKLPGDPWNNRRCNFYGIAWNFSMELHAKCPNPPWKISVEKFTWNSMEIGVLILHGIPRKMSLFHGDPWRNFHGNWWPNPPWNSMENFPWNFPRRYFNTGCEGKTTTTKPVRVRRNSISDIYLFSGLSFSVVMYSNLAYVTFIFYLYLFFFFSPRWRFVLQTEISGKYSLRSKRF